MSPKSGKLSKSPKVAQDNKQTFMEGDPESSLSKAGNPLLKKKDLKKIVKNEYLFISNYFNTLDIVGINHGKRKLNDEDEIENLQLLNIPEKKIFKKTPSKKGNAQTSSKHKPFPQTIDGIEKELVELKGTPMTYQKKLRKKGLQSRLIKKKRKEHKALLKQGKKGNTVVNGPIKLIKPVLNSNGNVVSNKFDFAENEVKKESKPRSGSFLEGSNPESLGKKTSLNAMKTESHISFASNQLNASISNKSKSFEKLNKSEHQEPNVPSVNVKKEHNSLGFGAITPKAEDKSSSGQSSLLFNKDNKMVFSKVFVPENNKKHKKKTESDPRKILDKLKEDSKKISELEKEDKEKAALIKEKQKWSAAFKRASGEKVRDDPELLKKSISREKNMKARSQKKWQARLDKVQKEKDDRQKKRTENIQARKTDKKKRKMKKAIKKGSYVPV